MRDTSAAKKAAIVTRKSLGQSNRQVAQKENVNPSTVSKINNRYGDKHNFDEKKPRSGRPRKLSDRDVRRALYLLSTRQAKNATDLQRAEFPHVTVDTVRKALRRTGLKAYARRDVPLITKRQERLRVDWAEKHCYWTAEDWRAVIFSDESKFNLFGSDGREWCWRKPGEALDPKYTKKKVKHGGGHIMVWGCITSHGVGRLHRIDGIMDRFQYVDILTSDLLGTLSDHNLDHHSIYFQQDGDSKHRSGHTKGFLELENIDLLPWAPSSPDMNCIENCWDHVNRMVRARDPLPSNLDELWEALQEEWYGIGQEYIDNLYNSMPNRVRELLKAKGQATRY